MQHQSVTQSFSKGTCALLPETSSSMLYGSTKKSPLRIDQSVESLLMAFFSAVTEKLLLCSFELNISITN